MKTYIITEQDIERLYTLFPDLGEGLQACAIVNSWAENLPYYDFDESYKKYKNMSLSEMLEKGCELIREIDGI